ncbi:hypothetical protein [Yersinia phage fHe-Yen9-03]|uniref:Uncharacterized protein n=1 Tax=Yersinia phage fHe-Yen9-03 TaxID=2052743 RepID=A0A2C9D0T8_9CAUD|nr:hypothetical protein [Yersinia phage fHe-Yen9-03]
MTDNEKLENILIEALTIINTSTYNFESSKDDSKSRFVLCGKRAQLKLYFSAKYGELSIEFIHHLIGDTLSFQINYYDDSDEDDDYHNLYGEIRIPRTEEQYFQYYTIQDHVFSLEFYKLLENIMNELLVKWQSG